MKIKVIVFVLSYWLSIFYGVLHAVESRMSGVAVTYLACDGRFGDQLLSYLHTKWISYRYGLPLLYKPFLFSEEFALHEKEERWTEEKAARFDQAVTYSKGMVFSSSSINSTLYSIPFFSDLADDVRNRNDWPLFSVDWKDEGFCQILREMFAPLKEHLFDGLPVSKDYLTVAIHLRTGGGVDYQHAFLVWPLRFPPISYYVECLYRICTLFPERAIYAYVFTDAYDPQQLIQKLQNQLSEFPITYAARGKGNRHGSDIIEDFFAMMRFDCLIRANSNFSLLPSMLANYKVVMTPKHFICLVKGFEVENYIDEIDIQL